MGFCSQLAIEQSNEAQELRRNIMDINHPRDPDDWDNQPDDTPDWLKRLYKQAEEADVMLEWEITRMINKLNKMRVERIKQATRELKKERKRRARHLGGQFW